MTNNSTNGCFAWKHDFEEGGIDQVILLIGYGLSGLVILLLNFVLIRALLKQPKTRSTMLLLILSISDVGVGSITFPFVMLRIVFINKDIYCALLRCTTFFSYFPFSFSFGVTTIISIDRCLMVTKSNFHTKYVTNRVITFILIGDFVSSISFSFVNTITFTLDATSKKAHIFQISQLVVEISFILFTCCLNWHLYCFVKRASQQMATSRHEGTTESYSSRLTTTIAYIFTCMVFFMGPQVMAYAMIINMENMSAMLRRNLYMWGKLLLYTNSYINAIILLTRSTNLQNATRKCKTEQNTVSIL